MFPSFGEREHCVEQDTEGSMRNEEFWDLITFKRNQRAIRQLILWLQYVQKPSTSSWGKLILWRLYILRLSVLYLTVNYWCFFAAKLNLFHGRNQSLISVNLWFWSLVNFWSKSILDLGQSSVLILDPWPWPIVDLSQFLLILSMFHSNGEYRCLAPFLFHQLLLLHPWLRFFFFLHRTHYSVAMNPW